MTDSAAWLAANAGIIIVALLVALMILLALVIWLSMRVARLERHYRSLLSGTRGGNLQMVLDTHLQELRSTVAQVRELNILCHRLEKDSRGHLQHVGLVRYNPFRETGGDQSFALAVTDARGNGAVISSLHMRDVTRVYAKPLQAWSSTHPLGDEEHLAIRQAQD